MCRYAGTHFLLSAASHPCNKSVVILPQIRATPLLAGGSRVQQLLFQPTQLKTVIRGKSLEKKK